MTLNDHHRKYNEVEERYKNKELVENKKDKNKRLEKEEVKT